MERRFIGELREDPILKPLRGLFSSSAQVVVVTKIYANKRPKESVNALVFGLGRLIAMLQFIMTSITGCLPQPKSKKSTNIIKFVNSVDSMFLPVNGIN